MSYSSGILQLHIDAERLGAAQAEAADAAQLGLDETGRHLRDAMVSAWSLIALGRRASLDTLDEDFHAQESPSARRPLAESVFAGAFGIPAFEREDI